MNPEAKFYLFRRHDFHEWIVACKNPKLILTPKTSLFHNHYVCDEHFIPSDYKCVLKEFQQKLNKNAIPKSLCQCAGDETGIQVRLYIFSVGTCPWETGSGYLIDC